MQSTSTTVVMPRQPGIAARMVAVFALGAASAGGLVYAIMARSAPVVVPAAAAPVQPVSQSLPPIVVQLVQPPAATPPVASEGVGSAVVGPPAPAAVAVVPPITSITPSSGEAATGRPPEGGPATSVVDRPAVSTASTARSAVAKVNLNAATQAELEALPLVGPSMAKRILEHRAKNGPFRQVKDLDKVKGVGEKTLARLMPLVYVDMPGDR
jgi:competence protein ComEA